MKPQQKNRCRHNIVCPLGLLTVGDRLAIDRLKRGDRLCALEITY